MNLYFAEPDNAAQLRRCLGTARRWLEGEDTVACLPDPHTSQDIIYLIELVWDGGWNHFAREQRRREGEPAI